MSESSPKSQDVGAAVLNGSNGTACGQSPAIPTAPLWSDAVIAVAEQNHVLASLDPLWQATREIFPTAQWIKVYLQDDYEVPNEKHIVFDVSLPDPGYPQYRAALRAWNMEMIRICSAPLTYVFQLLLDVV